MGPVMKGVRKVFSELDGDGRMRHGRWPGWKEQKAGSSQDEKKKHVECVLEHRKLTSSTSCL